MHGVLTEERVGKEGLVVRVLERGLMPSAFGYRRLYILSKGAGRYIIGHRFGRAEAPYYFLVERADIFGFLPEEKVVLYEISLGQENFVKGETLDLRPLEHGIRHSLVMERFSKLKEAETFFIVNDHDPLPLYFQIAMNFPGKVGWEYVDYGEDFWKIRIWRL